MDDQKTVKITNAASTPKEESSLADEPFAKTIQPGLDQMTPRVGQPAIPPQPAVGAEAATMQIGGPAPAAPPFARTAMPGADQPTPRPGQWSARGSQAPTPRPGQLPAQGAPQPPAAESPTWNAAPAAAPIPPTWNPPPAPAAPPAWGAPRPPAPPASPAGGRGDAATMMMGARPGLVFAWLVVLDGPDRGRIHQLQAEITSVGRAPGSNDIVVADNAVSSQHLKIRSEVAENGDVHYTLIDMASRNGVYVGAKTAYRDDSSRVYRCTLHDGDYLLLGETTLVFKCI